MSSTNIEQPRGKLFTFTIAANTAQIVKFETQEADGANHELTDEEKASLAGDSNGGRLEDVVEQAFEAGIDCVLGGVAGGETAEESEEDEELRHVLLKQLIKHSAAKRLLQQEALNRILLQTLIHHSMKPQEAVSGAPAAHTN